MPTHRIEKSWKDRLVRMLPFGVGVTKPKHFRDLLGIIWRNRDNLGYAYQVLTKGVCDGCALGAAACMTGLSRARTSA